MGYDPFRKTLKELIFARKIVNYGRQTSSVWLASILSCEKENYFNARSSVVACNTIMIAITYKVNSLVYHTVPLVCSPE